MGHPFNPSKQDVKNFLLGGVTIGAAFAAYKQVTEPSTILYFILFGLITLTWREIGQRITARWMGSKVDLEISQGGAITTLLVSMFSYISVFNVLFLVPVFSTFSSERYEHWGKSIDAIWAKRQYWLVSSGIIFLLIGWWIAYALSFSNLAELIALFTFFQLLPLDANKKICGKLDGAYIMLWTGFMWLVFMGLTIIMMILSVL